MIYNFDEVRPRRTTESYKWHAYPEDVLPLFVADMDFISPQPVVDALRERVDHGIFGYPKEMPEFRPVLLKWMEEQYGWKVDPDSIILMPGVVTAFNLACQAFGKPGEGVLVQPPVYPPFLSAAQYAGMTRQDAQLSRSIDGNYEIDYDAFEAAIKPETRIFILCNPHNPVGRVFRRNELEKMAEICLRHNLLIVSDEIHCDLIFTGYRHTAISSLSPEVADRTITLFAPSKTFNIAGLECSIAVIPNPVLRKQFNEAKRGVVGWVNLMGQVAALAAYRDGREWLEQTLGYLEKNRDYLTTYLKNELPTITLPRIEGTYLAWLDCRNTGIKGNPSEFFIKNAKVALNDGSTFGVGGDGFVRLNFGCPRSILAQALERMKSALREL
ncbi:MAG TPA: MalY/PatB family protein [Anaerolineaceae bacterium]